ncbi:MAG: hypothetical protein RLZZ258_988, partial [Actinomycetota bacterium]
ASHVADDVDRIKKCNDGSNKK